MNIYTYYVPIPGKSDVEEKSLIELWKSTWSAHGWNPLVIGEADIPADKEYKPLLKRFKKQPTTMKPGLSYSWFCRWLAVAGKGGGFMCDYDVMNYGFAPFEAKELTCYSGRVPCLVSGTAEEFLRMCEVFATYRADLKDRVGWRLDTSDMKIMIRRPETFIERQDCVEFLHPGWETATSVHYSNFGMKPKGYMPRHEWIPKLRGF